jgi:hypothetical protein
MPTAQRAAKGRQNGSGSEGPNPLSEAIFHEQRVADEAAAIWAEGNDPTLSITPRLYLRLRPLLRRAIPPGYIEHVGEVKGKPYKSTGVRSVQVQMDRLDNVLLPHNWGYSRVFSEGGKVCEVVAWIGQSRDEALVVRDSFGGVGQASTMGNLLKGAFTNAAKPAFARLGPAWEVYVGAADFDPDTDQSAAGAQAATEPQEDKDPNRPLSPAAVEKLQTAIEAKGIPATDVQMKLRGFGVESADKLTAEQGMGFWSWVNDWKVTEGG